MVEARDDDAGARVAASGAVATATGHGAPGGSSWQEEQCRPEGHHDGGHSVRHPVRGLEQADLTSRRTKVDPDPIVGR